jgi:septum formation protein
MLILASGSIRRKEILEALGAEIKIITADVDERSDEKDPEKLAPLLAQKKGLAVYERIKDGEYASYPIISADTVVYCDGEIMGKPKDAQDAYRMLKKLSSREHTVTTGICIVSSGTAFCEAVTTKVRVDELSDVDIKNYVDSKDPFDKAGGYGIQGIFSKHIKGIDGCYFNVVGLPVNALRNLGKKAIGTELF